MNLRVVLETVAPKLSQTGEIKYELLVDRRGVFYVRLTGNDESGSFSHLLFPVAEFAEASLKEASLKDVSGLELDMVTRSKSLDLNVSGFLKAALRDLLPKQTPFASLG